MNNWADNYVKEVNEKEELELKKRKGEIATELGSVSRRLKMKFGRYNKESKYVEKIMIPYVMRMGFYPPSFRGMVDGYEELLKFGKRTNRRIW